MSESIERVTKGLIRNVTDENARKLHYVTGIVGTEIARSALINLSVEDLMDLVGQERNFSERQLVELERLYEVVVFMSHEGFDNESIGNFILQTWKQGFSSNFFMERAEKAVERASEGIKDDFSAGIEFCLIQP